MLRAAITFFLIGLVSFLLGERGLLRVSADVGKLLLLIFFMFSALSFVAAVTVGRTDQLR
jgi:hypothetical protein